MSRTLDRETHPSAACACSPRRGDDGAFAARPRVLVAEDHEDTRFMLRVFLERRGFDVIEAANGEEALGLCESARPDIVLLDSGLPRIDGIGVTSRVRAGASSPRVPIIFLSGHAEQVAQRAAFDAGCNDYLTKPFTLDRLSHVLTQHLGDGGGPRGATRDGGNSA